jgi:iron complex outermembrane receptor protein
VPSTGTQTYNRANLLSFQGRCNAGDRMDQYAAALWGNPGFAFGCTWDNVGSQSLQSPVDRVNAVGRATIELSPNHTAIFEAVGSRTETERVFEHSQITTSIGAGNAYPANGPYYQNLSAYIPTFNAALPIAYRWRCYDCGPRTTNSTAYSWRYMAALEGSLGKFDYKLGISTAGNKSYTVLGDGYMKTNEFNAVLASGIVNPWLLPGQTQTAAALAAINGAKAAGTNLFGGEASLNQADGLISGEIYTLPWGGSVAAAAGFDVRKESYLFRNGATSTVPVRDAPFDAEFPKVSRDIKAIFTEVAIPLLKNLEATAAVRRDTYQVIGSTTNPKYSIKFTPSDQLLIRGSYSEGFKAPNFFQLYSATGESPVPGNVRDPILCPVGGTVTDLSVCAIRPNARAGGNPDLKPETSKQWTVGFVLAPVEWASITVDTYQIRRKGVVYELNGQQVIANYLTFPNNLVRGTDGRLDGPGGYIRAGYVNADGDILRGWDVSLKAQGRMMEGKWEASMDGTYTTMYDSRIFVTQPYLAGVGVSTTSDGTAVRNLFLRWKHIAKFTYTQGPWSATLTQNYSNGYKDEKPLGVVPPGWDSNVKAYVTHNVSVGYTGIKNTTLRFGIKNIADIKPPFTAHNVDFSPGAGWDPRVADPRLRAFTFSAQYKF